LPYIDIVVARRKAGTTTTAATAAVPDHDITPPGAARPAAARPRRVGSVELARGCYDEGQVKATCALRSSGVEAGFATQTDANNGTRRSSNDANVGAPSSCRPTTTRQEAAFTAREHRHRTHAPSAKSASPTSAPRERQGLELYTG